MPQDASTREALARQIGADGSQLIGRGRTAHPSRGLRDLPALEALRRIGLRQYDRCTVPGLDALRWRAGDEHPPAAGRIASPDDLEARDRSQRDTHGVGDTRHLTETGDADPPDLLTQVMTTPATTPDRVMGPAIQQDLAERDLLPGTHVLDSGSVDADLLVTAQTPHQIDVVGPPFGSSSRHWREGQGYDRQAFAIAWAVQQARCPQGHASVHWRPGPHVAGDPVMRIRFDGATCRACPTRRACTSAQAAPRQLTVSPQAHHEVLQAARQRQGTPPFQAPYALRAGVESSLSQGVRGFQLRRSRYRGLARPPLQPLLAATAMHVVRVIAWLWGQPLGERRRLLGHFAQLAPHPVSRQTALCERMTDPTESVVAMFVS